MVFSLNLAALLNLLLLAAQLPVFQVHWPSWVETWTWLFYVPVMSAGFLLDGLNIWSRTMFPAYCACFFLMAAASWAGCRLRRRNR